MQGGDFRSLQKLDLLLVIPGRRMNKQVCPFDLSCEVPRQIQAVVGEFRLMGNQHDFRAGSGLAQRVHGGHAGAPSTDHHNPKDIPFGGDFRSSILTPMSFCEPCAPNSVRRDSSSRSDDGTESVPSRHGNTRGIAAGLGHRERGPMVRYDPGRDAAAAGRAGTVARGDATIPATSLRFIQWPDPVGHSTRSVSA